MIRKFQIFLKQIFIVLFSKHLKLFNDRKYNEIIYAIMFGKKPNLDNPSTFNEHIISRKVKLDEYDLSIYTDKYEVRSYVRSQVGEKYLNSVLGVYNSFDEIDFSSLPSRFVLKANHGSSYNIIVNDKQKLNIPIARKKFKKLLKENYYYKGREKNYFKINPKIICEAFLEEKFNDRLQEFKIYCFFGKARFIAHNLIINGQVRTNFYNENWENIPVKRVYENFPADYLPDNKIEMIDVAERLATRFEFVRVDLYNIDGRIVFSELTFHSGGGFVPFTPPEMDKKFGRFFSKNDKEISL